MSAQPEALRIADELDKVPDFQARAWDAARELRRVHELNADLLEVLQYLLEVCPAINQEGEDAHIRARAAIAKATGGVSYDV